MIQARVPEDRLGEGSVEIVDAAGSVSGGPFACRAKADNAGAAQHGNHGGDPGETMMLRPTFGCLRVTNTAFVDMARFVRVGDVYVCEDA